MQNSTLFCSIYYSRILSLPVIGSLLYVLQTHILRLKLARTAVFSNRASFYRNTLITQISDNYPAIYCKSTNLRSILHQFKTQIIFDARIRNIERLCGEKLYDVMWTLVWCHKINHQSYHLIRKFVAGALPIIDK